MTFLDLNVLLPRIRRKLFEEKFWRNFVEIYKQNLMQTQNYV